MRRLTLILAQVFTPTNEGGWYNPADLSLSCDKLVLQTPPVDIYNHFAGTAELAGKTVPMARAMSAWTKKHCGDKYVGDAIYKNKWHGDDMFAAKHWPQRFVMGCPSFLAC